jgi:hypothetical protein
MQVTPTGVNMVVGGTQQFTAVDQLGRPRTDAAWTVSDTSIATITTDSSPVLTAVAVGQVTLTATVGSVTASTVVNVLSGTSLPSGAIQWSAPSASGFSTQQVLQAEPSAGSPAIYSITANGSADNTFVVAALSADGEQIWSNESSAGASTDVKGFSDGNGGILLWYHPSSGGDSLVDLDGPTGSTLWEYVSQGTLTASPFGELGNIAVGNGGNVYFSEFAPPSSLPTNPDSTPIGYLVALNGTTGAVVTRYHGPIGTDTDYSDISEWPSSISDPVIGPDGTVFAAVQTYNSTYTGSEYSAEQDLSLLALSMDGTTTLTQFYSDTSTQHACGFPCDAVNGLIPDGNGGAYVSWEYGALEGGYIDTSHVTDASSSGSTDFTPPFAATQMVLGDSGALIATDGQTASALSGGSAIWTYAAPSIYDELKISTATEGNGLDLTDENQGSYPYSESLVTLDGTGTPVGSAITVDSGSAPAPSGLGSWLGIINNSLATFSGANVIFPAANWPIPSGNAYGQNNSIIKVNLVAYDVNEADLSNAAITQDINTAISFWDTKANIALTWNQNITGVPGCAADLAAGTCNADSVLDVLDDDGLATDSEIIRRFEQPSGVVLLFTGVVNSSTANGHTMYTSPSGSGPLHFLNLSAIGATAPALVVAHEVGHQFQLQHVLSPFNLMCGSSIPVCPNTPSQGLSTSQISTARTNATNLQ